MFLLAAQVWNPHTSLYGGSTLVQLGETSTLLRLGCRQLMGYLISKFWTKSSAESVSLLHWPTLESCQIFLHVPFLYDILHKRYSSLSFNSFYNFKSSSTRQHPLYIVPLQSTINAYPYSFFCQYSIYLELYTILHTVPHQGRVLSKGSKNLSFS